MSTADIFGVSNFISVTNNVADGSVLTIKKSENVSHISGNFLTKLRFYLIRWLAGSSVVMINVSVRSAELTIHMNDGMIHNCEFLHKDGQQMGYRTSGA